MKSLIAVFLILIMIIGLPALAINLKTVRADPTFIDNFDDGAADGWTPRVGSWSVINGEYCVSVGVVENGISTVNGLNLADCTIETIFRFTDSVGFRTGIVFRYSDNQHYYSLELSNEYDKVQLFKYSPADPDYAEILKPTYGNNDFTINANVTYQLRLEVIGSNFNAYLNGQKVLSGIDSSYSAGLVGLRARRADACFDNFKIEDAVVAPLSTPTPTPSPFPITSQSLQSFSDDFSTDSGAWQYLGSAYRDQTNQNLVLTTSSNDQTGVAFFRAPIQGSFIANFSYKGSGDGFLFFFYKQKYPSTIDWEESYGDNGVAGGRLGFNTQSIIPGYGIEFDGWANIAYEFADIVGGQPNPSADPSDHHIALIKDFTGDHLAYVNDQRIYDNVWHQVSVQVQGSSVAVYFDQALTLQWSGVLDRTYDGCGFSGSNGQVEASWHEIDDFSINAHNLKTPSLTLSCKSSTSYSGFNVEIKGNLAFNGTAISNAPILLSYSVTGGKRWEDLTLVYTDSDGSYSAAWLPSVTGYFMVKATYEANDNYLGTTEIVNFAVVQSAEKNVFSVNSNSTVSSLAFDSQSHELNFTVTGESGTTGYADVYIAKSLIGDIANVKAYLDGGKIEYTATSIDDSWLLHFSYQHSIHEVSIGLGLPPPPASVLENPLALALIVGGLLALPFSMAFLFMRKRSAKSKLA